MRSVTHNHDSDGSVELGRLCVGAGRGLLEKQNVRPTVRGMVQDLRSQVKYRELAPKADQIASFANGEATELAVTMVSELSHPLIEKAN